MMNKHDYQQAMNSIKISDSFKSRTAQLMREERDKNTADNSEYLSGNYTAMPEKRRFIPFLRYGGIVLTAAAVIAAAGIYSVSRSADIADTTAGDDPQPAEAAPELQETVMLYKNADAEYDIGGVVGAEDVDEEVDDSADVSYDNDAGSAAPETFAGKNDEAAGEGIILGAPPSTEVPDQPRLSDFIAENADAKFSGNAEIVRYMLAENNEKRPDDMPSESAQIDEFPYDVIKAVADAESTGEAISYVDPAQYAGAKELYSSIGWNGYALTMNFYSGDASFSFTVCGDTITDNSLSLTYKLTPDQFGIFAEFSNSRFGTDLYK